MLDENTVVREYIILQHSRKNDSSKDNQKECIAVVNKLTSISIYQALNYN